MDSVPGTGTLVVFLAWSVGASEQVSRESLYAGSSAYPVSDVFLTEPPTSTPPHGHGWLPSVTGVDKGSFVIGWQGELSSHTALNNSLPVWRIYAQMYAPDASPTGTVMALSGNATHDISDRLRLGAFPPPSSCDDPVPPPPQVFLSAWQTTRVSVSMVSLGHRLPVGGYQTSVGARSVRPSVAGTCGGYIAMAAVEETEGDRVTFRLVFDMLAPGSCRPLWLEPVEVLPGQPLFIEHTSVAPLSSGDVVVGWFVTENTTAYFRTVSADNRRLGPVVSVPTRHPISIASLSGGAFVVARAVKDSVSLLLYNASSSQQREVFTSYKDGLSGVTAQRPSVSRLGEGFVVAWRGVSSAAQQQGRGCVFAQLFNADGTARGHALQIDTVITTSFIGNPVVAEVPGTHRFVVAWDNVHNASLYRVFGQLFEEGAPLRHRGLGTVISLDAATGLLLLLAVTFLFRARKRKAPADDSSLPTICLTTSLPNGAERGPNAVNSSQGYHMFRTPTGPAVLS
eukprot:Rhum_TRINITY_DN23182_c0_g1::Rhum_TRINITY_DN23182_c0_g1_i1::g.177335::m.177335